MRNLLDRIATAGREANPEWTPERAVAVEQAMLRRRARRQTRRWAGAGVVAVLVVLAIGGYRWRSGHPRVVDRTILFADGSRALPLGPDAQLTVLRADVHRTISELRRGGYRFTVARNRPRVFEVRAGAISVEVLGTEFELERTSLEQVRVHVESGRVRVVWPGRSTELAMGQGGVFPPPGATPATTNKMSPVPARVEVQRQPKSDQSPRKRWTALARAGDYDQAYAALRSERQAPLSAVELMLAADVARLSHHPEQAVDPLRRVLSRHPRDPRAPLAAFTLGRIFLDDLGRPKEAAAAFGRARSLAPAGPLAPDALAREVEALSRAGDEGSARERAEEYVSRYPRGTRLRSVRRFGGLE